MIFEILIFSLLTFLPLVGEYFSPTKAMCNWFRVVRWRARFAETVFIVLYKLFYKNSILLYNRFSQLDTTQAWRNERPAASSLQKTSFLCFWTQDFPTTPLGRDVTLFLIESWYFLSKANFDFIEQSISCLIKAQYLFFSNDPRNAMKISLLAALSFVTHSLAAFFFLEFLCKLAVEKVEYVH